MRAAIRSTMGTMGVVALLLAGCGGAEDGATDTAVATGSGAAATVATARGALGTFLIDGDGRTLYLFTEDSPGASTCTDACLVAWPALLTDSAPVASMGVDATLLGTITRADGGTQVTYNGWPLYLYAGDAAPGDTVGQGVGDVWFVVSPSGELLAMEADLDEDTSRGGYGYGSGGGGAYGEGDSGGSDY